mgnify:CR=1 FL=1
MIGGYGHDDRVCAYPAAMAAFACEKPEYTAITVLTDKEETGSDGQHRPQLLLSQIFHRGSRPHGRAGGARRAQPLPLPCPRM